MKIVHDEGKDILLFLIVVVVVISLAPLKKDVAFKEHRYLVYHTYV